MMMDAKTAIAALLAGTAIGVGLGILFAPDKGEVTREKLKERAKKSTEELEEHWGENVSRVKGKVDVLIVDLERRLEDLRKYMKVNEQVKENVEA